MQEVLKCLLPLLLLKNQFWYLITELKRENIQISCKEFMSCSETHVDLCLAEVQ